MPKRKSTTSSSFAGAETYDSDNGFVEDAPVGKKSRVQNGAGKEGGKNNKKANTKEEEEAGEEIPGGGLVGRDGECSWEVCALIILAT